MYILKTNWTPTVLAQEERYALGELEAMAMLAQCAEQAGDERNALI